ncbi:MAG: MBL fold metallo-hydrolase [Verrucomicrobia bacterium]|nr:MBL fold metallo-hydrolase [Verrucomicrobiota bacterium]
MKLHFLGANKNVTGSKHLVEVSGLRILMDCGQFQGPRKEARERNSHLPCDPASIDVLLLSHAHIDHSGLIPVLTRDGFNGTIFCTHATRDLCAIMLLDSAHIQESDAEYLNRKKKHKDEPPVEPLYTQEDAAESLKFFQSVPYDRPVKLGDGVEAVFREAGHILGSTQIELNVRRNGGGVGKNGDLRRLFYTADLGRDSLPILRDPHIPSDVDYFIIESTYGNRVHDDYENAESKLAAIVNRAVKARGKIIIPAFSVGRTQEVLYSLARLVEKGATPPVPVYLDSPLSVNATEIFRSHPECFDRETRALIRANKSPLGMGNVTYTRDVEESKQLNQLKGPMIIVSASGMCEAGRILHHLKNNIGDARNIVLIVGYCAQHTLGKRLVEKEPVVKIFGEEYERRAQVEVINAFSAHADRIELLDYVERVHSNVKHFFVVHGDEDQSIALSDTLREMGYSSSVPNQGNVAEL